ncbi:MAG: hypothetical protein J6O00_03585 [Clostridiales bacterium]|nr:hypothetical protein [Clostridiales bacterium]
MKTYYFKIREKYIESIRNGQKSHEYRLATLENRNVRVGDNLVLISNIDKKDYVRTSITRIRICSDWESALRDNWHQDFNGLFDSFGEVLKECFRFYPKSEVERYGIIEFEIKPVSFDYYNTSVLLDTNIIIKRESSNNVSFEISKLFNWFDRNRVIKYIHPSTKKELENYRDDRMRAVMLTKTNAYEVLPRFDIITDAFFYETMSLFSKDANSIVDNDLLLEIYNDNVGLLITDDTLMLKKAELLYIRDRVLSSAEMLNKYESKYPQNIEYKMLSVQLKSFDEIDLSNHFFDSLREDYEGQKFDRWFKRKGHELAYVFEDNGDIKGFLYLKIEDENEPDYYKVIPPMSPKRRMKVGTFKIESTGFRLGERFLRIIFDNARKSQVEEIYVTLFEDRREDVRHLMKTMMAWGFSKYGVRDNGEIVLVKNMEQYDVNKSPKYNYPLIKTNFDCYILPIYPEYHTDLFPDMILSVEDMHLYAENKAHRYALEKVYLSGKHGCNVAPGDLVLIYRMGSRYPKKYSSVITGIAVVEEIIETQSVDECVEKCKNRSIFEEKEIRANYYKWNTIIKLLDYLPFKTKVTLEKLQKYRVIEPPKGPRPFEPITREQYDLIYRMGMEDLP